MAIWSKQLTRGAAAVVLAAVVLLAPAPLSAQDAVSAIVGSVRDSSGRPIPGVSIRFRGTVDYAARTDDSGAFRFASLPAGRASLEARRLGFAPATMQLRLRAGQTDSVALAMTAVVASLPGVLVEDEHDARSKRLLAGFWERRGRGFGYFITRDQIDQRDPHDFVSLARMVPSVYVQTRNGRRVLRFNRAGTRGDCPPQYFVDGMRLENATPDEFSPHDVEAVELYSGPSTTPPQFAPRTFNYTCGAVVIWTRLPG